MELLVRIDVTLPPTMAENDRAAVLAYLSADVTALAVHPLRRP